MKEAARVFIWTEAFNCTEILPPFLDSFRKHHSLDINVVVSAKEKNQLPKNPGVNYLTLNSTKKSLLFQNHEEKVIAGYRKGHLGTARIWSHLIQNRKEDFFIHLDADTVFLGEILSGVIETLNRGYDFVGTRRPYLNRGYRRNGRDGKSLDKRPDALNTDILGFRRNAIVNRYSPFLTRWIRGKRPLRYPVVDYFDPVIFKALSSSRSICYLDSPNSGSSAYPDLSSEFFTKRISFAAVGSGLSFIKNPKIETSPGYRAYAVSSYSLYAKYLLGQDTGLPTLDNPDIEERLKLLDRVSWTLKSYK